MEIDVVYVIRKGTKINDHGFDWNKLYTTFEEAEDEYQLLLKRYPHQDGYYQMMTLDKAIQTLLREETYRTLREERNGTYNQH